MNMYRRIFWIEIQFPGFKELDYTWQSLRSGLFESSANDIFVPLRNLYASVSYKFAQPEGELFLSCIGVL